MEINKPLICALFCFFYKILISDTDRRIFHISVKTLIFQNTLLIYPLIHNTPLVIIRRNGSALTWRKYVAVLPDILTQDVPVRVILPQRLICQLTAGIISVFPHQMIPVIRITRIILQSVLIGRIFGKPTHILYHNRFLCMDLSVLHADRLIRLLKQP